MSHEKCFPRFFKLCRSDGDPYGESIKQGIVSELHFCHMRIKTEALKESSLGDTSSLAAIVKCAVRTN